MSSGYETSGRTRQKQRTRLALVAAARELLAEGTTPTVEQAADRAGISRTTSYRYFRNRRALLLAVYPGMDAPSLLGTDAPEDPSARLALAVRHFTDQLLALEPEARAQLRLSLEPGTHDRDLPFRQGRGIGWFEDALSPLRGHLSDDEIHRLALAVRATCGIEALVWLTDIGGLTRDEAVELMRWSASVLADAVIGGAKATN
jgi:AcrR family transcriptional regulator